MTQSINDKHVLMAIFVLVSLCSQAMSVLILTGLSFSDWSEQVQFHIGVLDLIWFLMLRNLLLLMMLVTMKRKLIIKLRKGQTDLV